MNEDERENKPSPGSDFIKPILDGVTGNGAYDALKKLFLRVRRSQRPGTQQEEQVAHWVDRINTTFRKDVHIYGEVSQPPSIDVIGPFPLTSAQEQAAKLKLDEIIKKGRTNDPHGIVVNKIDANLDPPHCSVQTIDFASISALRDEQVKPRILSCSAVIVCPEERALLLHLRGPDVATFKSCYHTIGGAYIPRGSPGVDPDRDGLRSTILREIAEETQAYLSDDEAPKLMMSEELETGFVQLVFLGLRISKEKLERAILQRNYEGQPIRVPFDSILGHLQNPNWVTTGKAHVLAWLATGAQNGGQQVNFGGYTASQLFETILATSKR